MKKTLLDKSLVLSFAMLAASTSLWGQNFTDDVLLFAPTGNGNEVAVSCADKSNVTGVITVPATAQFNGVTYTVTTIAAEGFKGSKITGINLPATLTTIGNYAFAESKQLESMVIPKSVSSIGANAFEWAENIQTFSFEAGSAVTAIEHHTFKGLNKVKEFEIPEGVTVIGDWALEGMKAMGSLTLPQTLVQMGDGCIADCVSLSAFTIKAPTPPATNGRDPFKNNLPFSTCALYVPDNSVESYRNTSPYNKFTNIQAGESVTFTLGDYTYMAIGDGEVSLIKVAPAVTNAVIPGLVTNEGRSYKVVAIGGSVFKERNITSVELPDGLRTIGGEAFSKCGDLTSIRLPEGLETIGAGAFNQCGVKEFVLPNSVTSIGEKCFQGQVEYLQLSAGCQVLPKELCIWSRITEIVVPEGVTAISERALMCNQHATRVYLPSTLKQVGARSFDSSDAIRNVTCAAAVAPTGGNDALFSTSVYETATLTVPVGSLKSYEETAPWNKFHNIVEADIITSNRFEDKGIEYELINNKTVRVVGFGGSLSSVVIPDAVKYNDAFVTVVEIGESAFAGTSITSVEICQSVKTIGSKAFAGIDLKAVTEYSPVPPVCAPDAFSAGTFAGAVLTVGAQCKDAYMNAEVWNKFNNIVEEVQVDNAIVDGNFVYTVLDNGCVSVGLTPEALRDPSITTVVVPEEFVYGGVSYTVTAVTAGGFKDFGRNVDSDETVADNTPALKTVVLPETIEELGYEAFQNAMVESVNLPSSLVSLGERCFMLSQLSGTVIVPDGIIEIPMDAFSWTFDLDKVVLPSGLETIGENAFFYSHIKEINIPASVGEMGNAFFGANAITKVEIEDLEAYLGQSMSFYGCSPFYAGNAMMYANDKWVFAIDYRDYNFTETGAYLFYGCAFLEQIIFPEVFNTIGYKAFRGCSGINSITIYSEIPIESLTLDGAFDEYVYRNANLYIPNGTLAAYREHHEWGLFHNIIEMDEDESGVDEVDADSNGISVAGGEIANPQALEVKVYDVTGRLIYAGNQTVINPAVTGLVIVKCGDTTMKVIL